MTVPDTHTKHRHVNQDRFSDDPRGGNCLTACIASILGVDLSEVPDFDMRADGPETWAEFYGSWLASIGKSIITVDVVGGDLRMRGAGSIILLGSTERNSTEIGHAVVGIIDGYGEYVVIHDPHPSRSGLKSVTGAVVIW